MKTIYIETPNFFDYYPSCQSTTSITSDGFYEQINPSRYTNGHIGDFFDYKDDLELTKKRQSIEFDFDAFNIVNPKDIINKPYNIFVNDKMDIVFEVAAVSVDKENIKVESKDTVITIDISQSDSEDNTMKKYLVNKLVKSDIGISYDVGDNYDLSKTSVSLNKGMLTVTIPIKEEKKPKEYSFEIK